MRILVVSQYFWPETFRVNDLVCELEARGHDVTVLTGIPNYPDGSVLPEFRAARGAFDWYGSTQVVRVPLLTRGRGGMRLLLNYVSFVISGSVLGTWRLRDRPVDVVFVFQPSPVTSCIPAIVCAYFKNAPVILWTLDLWPETLAAVGVVRAPWLLTLVGQVVRAIYLRCDLVLGQSRSFRGNIVRYSGDDSRFRYFPSWADTVFATPSQTVRPAPELERLSPGGFNIVFAGNIGDAQDFPTILRAASLLRERQDIRWLIVGDGRAAESVRAAIAARQLGSTVVLLGRHSLERMPEFFRAADALLVTLRRDPVFALTIPGKLQAYLAAGIPVLAALDGEGAAVIGEAQAGLVSPAGDATALAANALTLAALPAHDRAAMGARGRAYCAREFDRATLVTQLEVFFRESVERYAAQS